MSSSFVAILRGSGSDSAVMQGTLDALKSRGVKYEVKSNSVHRTPAATNNYIFDADSRGCQAIICAAGLAAHVAGNVAAHTLKPVIGVPMDGGPLSGMDTLLSTLQMPGGMPVATVAIAKDAAKDAALQKTL